MQYSAAFVRAERGAGIDRMHGTNIIGCLTRCAGLTVPGSQPVTDEAAFARTIILIR